MNFLIGLAASVLMCSFAMPSHAFAPASGQWWNPNESGTGYNIDVHNGVLVVTVFTYKTNGDSEWYLASGTMSADQHSFSGTLDKYRSGPCISCFYTGRPALIGNDGVITITFVTESSATVTLPGGRTTNIQPFFASATNSRLDGTYRLARASLDYAGGPLLDTALGNLTAGGTLVIAGNELTESVTLLLNGSAGGLSVSGTFADYGEYIVFVFDGVQYRGTLVTRGSVLIIETISAPASTLPYAEIDRWELVSTATAKHAQHDATLDAVPAPFLGGAVGSVLTRLQNNR